MARQAWFIYRDTLTGRFAKKSTWKRSKERDGTRYKRQRVKRKEPPPPPPPEAPVYEWLVTFTYEESGRSFDVIVTARDETEAVQVATQFLRDDPDAQRIVKARFHSWSAVPARGQRSTEQPGEAEYRGNSKK